MKILLNGALGKMGRAIMAETEKDSSLSICAFVDVGYESTDAAHFNKMPEDNVGADIIIDFSHHSAIFEIAEYAKKYSIPAVICTTGQTESELECINELAKNVPVFFSANMSMGIALTVELAKRSAAVLPHADIEIIEKHHSAKLDSPSGTALMLANAIKSVRENLTLMLGRSGRRVREKGEIGIHAVRAGSIVGEHEVILATEHEIITISHAASSRSVFADGALNAAKWLVEKKTGLYTMQSLISD